MSTTPDADFSLELHFLPAWAKESPQQNRYADHQGDRERVDDRRSTRRDRPPRRSRPPGAPRDQGPSARQDRPRPDGGRPPRRPGGDGRPGRRDDRPRGREQGRPPEPVLPLPEINVAFIPEEIGVDSLARQIRSTGRAYPLFDIAQMILAKPERHTVTFSVKTRPDKTPVQPLHLCALDDTLWLSEDDAVRHLLDRHFATFYQPEKTQIDPPKGVYTFVAQCGMSGVILGPPNHHDYQNQLRRLHAERFGRMPFDVFKARVKIVKDPEVVKKWIEDQSWRTEYTALNVPEPIKFTSREEVEKHFRQVHLANLVKSVETHRLTGAASRNLRDRALMRLLRQRWEEQKRFPIQIATSLSQQFAARGLQFFKVNRSVTHVAVARPHFLDMEATPVSESVRRIVEFINAHPRCTHKQLLETLAPAPAPTITALPVPPGETNPVSADAPAPASAPAPSPPEPSPELAAVMTDLHWLIHQGHVIEFANGVLETAKKPLPKPEKPAPKPAAATETAPVVATEGTEPIPAPAAESTPGVAMEEVEIPAAEPATTPSDGSSVTSESSSVNPS